MVKTHGTSAWNRAALYLGIGLLALAAPSPGGIVWPDRLARAAGSPGLGALGPRRAPRRPYLGAASRRVSMHVYADFQCPFSRRLAPVLDRLARHYRGRSFAVIWHDYPLSFHRQAMPAALVGRAVLKRRGNAAFWKYLRRIFRWHGRRLTIAVILGAASAVGLSTSDAMVAMADARAKAALEKEMRSYRALGVRGTPTMIINGRTYRGARTVPAFAARIDPLL